MLFSTSLVMFYYMFSSSIVFNTYYPIVYINIPEYIYYHTKYIYIVYISLIIIIPENLAK